MKEFGGVVEQISMIVMKQWWHDEDGCKELIYFKT